VARALIVGCGCRGRDLGQRLIASGWQVRGTSRDADRLSDIETAAIEPALADPDRAATVLPHLEGVAVLFWLLGSAQGKPESVAALHGPRLERLLEEIVDTPVRGFVYEAAGATPAADRERGAVAVAAASRRWRIPVEVVDADPTDHRAWREAMLEAAKRLTGS
jgi:uncharacterized protein YbjT (DUF2867 family)